MSELELDYLFLEGLFIERIKQEVPGLSDVTSALDLESLDENLIGSPSVFVVYLGDSPIPGPAGQGGLKKIQATKQYWAFVLCINSADPNNDGEAARREAGPLIGQLLVALQGWEPAADVDALCRAERSVPAGWANGVFYFPYVFYTTFIFPRKKAWAPKQMQ